MTTDIRFGERELQAAAKLVAESMLEGLPDAVACGHDFSEGFRRKMEALLRRQRRRSIRHTVWRYAAAVLLTVTLTFGAVMAVSPQARAAVVQWVRTVYENSVVYRFFNPAPQGALPRYQLTWLPEGFAEVDAYVSQHGYSFLYMNENTEQGIAFDYSYMRDGVAPTIASEGGYTISHAEINGMLADFYQMSNENGTNVLVLIDEKAGIIFTISANTDKDSIFNIAEGMALCK